MYQMLKKIIQETLLEYPNPDFNDITNPTLKIPDDLFLDTLLMKIRSMKLITQQEKLKKETIENKNYKLK